MNKPQHTPDLWTICFDTICQGWQAVQDEDAPCTYATEAQAQAEIDGDPEFYEDCFPARLSDIGRRAVYGAGGLRIVNDNQEPSGAA